MSHLQHFTCSKKKLFQLDGKWCGRRVIPAVCDCVKPSHQFIRSRHTTINTDHYMQKNPVTQQDPNRPVHKTCQKHHDHIFHQEGRRDWSHEGQWEGKGLDNRMCCHHIKSQSKTQTFTLYTHGVTTKSVMFSSCFFLFFSLKVLDPGGLDSLLFIKSQLLKHSVIIRLSSVPCPRFPLSRYLSR